MERLLPTCVLVFSTMTERHVTSQRFDSVVLEFPAGCVGGWGVRVAALRLLGHICVQRSTDMLSRTSGRSPNTGAYVRCFEQ